MDHPVQQPEAFFSACPICGEPAIPSRSAELAECHRMACAADHSAAIGRFKFTTVTCGKCDRRLRLWPVTL